jgi:type IV pilus assembly protein PilV
MNNHRYSKLAMRQQGATLIEVLVSILLMSIGLVSMAAMQVNAVQYSKTSEMRSLANLLANDIADRMRANKPSVASYNTPGTTYQEPSALPADASPRCITGAEGGLSGEAVCTEAQMAAYDLAAWHRDLYSQLPKGTGVVRTASNDQVDIWVVWTDPASSNGQDADNCPKDYAPTANVRCMYFRVAL